MRSGSGTLVVYPPSENAVTKPARRSSSTFSSRMSTLTPRQRVSSFVHFVTQEMSLMKSCAGSLRNSAHPHETGSFTSPSILKDHDASGVRGVGPAERTGKSLTRCCPGGMRAACAEPAGSLRPTNPRVTNRSGTSGSLGRLLSSCVRADRDRRHLRARPDEGLRLRSRHFRPRPHRPRGRGLWFPRTERGGEDHDDQAPDGHHSRNKRL